MAKTTPLLAFRLILAAALLTLAHVQTVVAANLTWTTTPGGTITEGGGTWTTGSAGWWTGAANANWAASDNATFGGGSAGTAGTVTLGGNISANKIIFNTPFAGNYTLDLAGNTLTTPNVAGAINIATNTTTTISDSAGTGAWTIGNTGTTQTINSAGSVAVNAKITGAGNMYVAGAGNVTLNNNSNSFTGLLAKINSGPLTISSIKNSGVASAAGAGSTVQVGDNGLIIYNGSGDSTDRTLEIFRGGNAFLRNNGGSGALIWTGPISNTSTASKTFNLGGSNTANNELKGALIDNGSNLLSVNKADAGTWVLSGNNTYTGLTTVSLGTLTLSGNNNAATGGVTLTAGTLNINNANALGTGALTLSANTTINNTSGAAITNLGNQSWALNDGLTFGNANSTSANNLNLGSGSVTVSDSRAITLAGTNTTLTMGSANLTNTAGARTLTANGTGNTLVLGGLSLSQRTLGAVTVTLAGTANIRIEGAIVPGTAFAHALTITNTGTTTLSGNNTYGGLTTMNAADGTLTLGGNNSGAAGGVTLTAGTLNINNANALGTGALTLSANTTINNTSGAAITNLGNQSWTLNDGLTFGNANSTSANNLNLGSGSVTVSDSLAITLAGTNSTLTMGSANITSTAVNRILTANGTGNTLLLGGLSLSQRTSATTATLAGTANIRIEGAIVPGTAFAHGLTITNTGTTTLSGNNTYTGATTISAAAGTLTLGGNNSGAAGGVTLTAGTLNINNANALGTGALTLSANTTINNTSGAAITNLGNQSWALNDGLTFGNANSTSANNLNLGSGSVTVSASSAITLAGTNTTLTMGSANITSTLSGRTLTANGAGNTLVLGGLSLSQRTSATTATLAGTANIRIDGAIVPGTAFAHGLTITNTGTTTLSGNNTYTGATTISAGTLEIGAAGRLGGGSYAGAITNNAAFIYSGTNAQTLSGVISGTGDLTKNGTGTLTLSGANTYTGITTISAGTLTLGANQAIGAIAGTGALDLSSFTLTSNSSTTTNFTGVISGTGGLTKNGAGTLTLSGANTYTGATTISAGTIKLGAAGVISDSSNMTVQKVKNAAADGVFDLAGFNETIGALTLGSTSTDATNSGQTPSVINSGGAAVLTLNGTLDYNSGTAGFENGQATVSANIALASGSSVNRNFSVADSPVAAVDLLVSGVISSDNSLQKTGLGTLRLTNANTYTRSTLIDVGVIEVTTLKDKGTASSLGTGNATATTDLIRMGSTTTATLTYIGTGDSTNRRIQIGTGTVASSTGGATLLNNGSGALTFTNSTFNNPANTGTGTDGASTARTLTLGGSNTGPNTIQGVIADNTGTETPVVNLVKQDAGTWVLSGNNTYTGSTTVNAGTLQAAASGALANTSQVVLNNGGSFLVTEANAVNDSAAINLNGGKLAVSGAFDETVGALTLSANSTIDLAGFAGTLRFGGVGSWASGSNLAIWNWNGIPEYGTAVGDGLNNRHVVFTNNSGLDSYLDRISFYSDSGSSFVGNAFAVNNFTPGGGTEIIAVPEPESYATALMLLLAIGAVQSIRRRAKQKLLKSHGPV
jgi:autotransporter-associated beta strand protein